MPKRRSTRNKTTVTNEVVRDNEISDQTGRRETEPINSTPVNANLSGPSRIQSSVQISNPVNIIRNLESGHNNQAPSGESRFIFSSGNDQPSNIKGSDVSGLKALIDIIPAFTGRNNISVQTFTRECKFFIQRVDQGLRPLFVKLLRPKIQGEADLFIRNRHFETLDELLGILEIAFGTPKSIFQIEAEIAHIKQMKGETILSYGARVMDLFNKIVELTAQQSPPSVAVIKVKEYDLEVASCFRLGLEGELEARVRQRNPSTLQEAINIAIEAERDVNRRLRLRGDLRNDSSATGTEYNSGADCVISNPSQGRVFRPVYQVQGKRPRNENHRGEPTCFICGEEGHYARSCPNRNANSFPYNPNASKRRRDSYCRKPEQDINIKSCDYCKAKGHTVDTCFKRRAEEAERELEFLKRERPSTAPTLEGSLNSPGVRRQGAATGKSLLTVRQSDVRCSQSTKNGI